MIRHLMFVLFLFPIFNSFADYHDDAARSESALINLRGALAPTPENAPLILALEAEVLEIRRLETAIDATRAFTRALEDAQERAMTARREGRVHLPAGFNNENVEVRANMIEGQQQLFNRQLDELNNHVLATLPIIAELEQRLTVQMNILLLVATEANNVRMRMMRYIPFILQTVLISQARASLRK